MRYLNDGWLLVPTLLAISGCVATMPYDPTLSALTPVARPPDSFARTDAGIRAPVGEDAQLITLSLNRASSNAGAITSPGIRGYATLQLLGSRAYLDGPNDYLPTIQAYSDIYASTLPDREAWWNRRFAIEPQRDSTTQPTYSPKLFQAFGMCDLAEVYRQSKNRPAFHECVRRAIEAAAEVPASQERARSWVCSRIIQLYAEVGDVQSVQSQLAAMPYDLWRAEALAQSAEWLLQRKRQQEAIWYANIGIEAVAKITDPRILGLKYAALYRLRVDGGYFDAAEPMLNLVHDPYATLSLTADLATGQIRHGNRTAGWKTLEPAFTSTLSDNYRVAHTLAVTAFNCALAGDRMSYLHSANLATTLVNGSGNPARTDEIYFLTGMSHAIGGEYAAARSAARAIQSVPRAETLWGELVKFQARAGAMDGAKQDLMLAKSNHSYYCKWITAGYVRIKRPAAAQAFIATLKDPADRCYAELGVVMGMLDAAWSE